MKIALIGKNGQLGTTLAPMLVSLGDLTAVDYPEIDLRAAASIERFLNAAAPNLVVNAAAYTDVDGAESDRETAFAVNAAAPEIMARWVARTGARLVHYSTDYVFDGSGTTPRFEDDPTGPLNVYGESKLAGEVAVRSSGADHLIFRTSWLYSPFGKNFLLTMLRLGREKEELRVVDDQVGAPTSARVAADVTVQILRGGAGRSGLYHLTCRGETSWCGFATGIFERARPLGFDLAVRRVIPIRSGEFAAEARRPGNSRLALGKLLRDFAVTIPSWAEALEETLKAMGRSA